MGAGCFWGVEEELQNTPGVVRTRVGYSGGNLENPSYEEVSSGDTGHVEAVEVEFDDQVLSFEDLLERFWSIHSATVDPRWREMIGRQYQSVIFYQNDEQKLTAERKKKEYEDSSKREVSTVIEPLKVFYPAEERHQNYKAKRALKK